MARQTTTRALASLTLLTQVVEEAGAVAQWTRCDDLIFATIFDLF